MNEEESLLKQNVLNFNVVTVENRELEAITVRRSLVAHKVGRKLVLHLARWRSLPHELEDFAPSAMPRHHRRVELQQIELGELAADAERFLNHARVLRIVAGLHLLDEIDEVFRRDDGTPVERLDEAAVAQDVDDCGNVLAKIVHKHRGSIHAELWHLDLLVHLIRIDLHLLRQVALLAICVHVVGAAPAVERGALVPRPQNFAPSHEQ